MSNRLKEQYKKELMKTRSFAWGKYEGELIADVYQIDPDYVDWIYDNNKSKELLRMIEIICYGEDV